MNFFNVGAHKRASVTQYNINGNRKFWKSVNPLIFERLFHKERIPVISKDKIISEENKLLEKFSWGFRRISWIYLSGRCSRWFRTIFKKIPGNAEKKFRKCWRRFLGMFKKVLGNVQKDFGKFSKKNQGMLKKIRWNFWKDSRECFWKIRGNAQKILRENIQENSSECLKRLWGMLKKIGCFITQLYTRI